MCGLSSFIHSKNLAHEAVVARLQNQHADHNANPCKGMLHHCQLRKVFQQLRTPMVAFLRVALHTMNVPTRDDCIKVHTIVRRRRHIGFIVCVEVIRMQKVKRLI